MSGVRLSLGPNPYYWRRRDVEAFYDEAAASRVDIVYLGEVVCGKRHELAPGDWIDIGRRLARAGKQVVLSCLALPESETDLRSLRRLVANGEFAIEANDMGAVKLAADARVPFVIGPHVNAYNPPALGLLARCGAVRWVPPIEVSRESLVALRAARHDGMETELFAYGRLPLAFSARCFTARAHDRGKDDCGFACIDDPDGLPLATADGEPLLALNGIQTQSARPYSLASALGDVQMLGVDVLRISPQSRHTFEIARIFRDCLDGRGDPAAAAAALDALTGHAASAGYWHGKAGMQVVPAAQP
jgi:collagenase-like PrtC family protease